MINPMVLISDDNSEKGAHMRSDLIFLKHLFRPKKVTNLFKNKLLYFPYTSTNDISRFSFSRSKLSYPDTGYLCYPKLGPTLGHSLVKVKIFYENNRILCKNPAVV